MPNVEKRKVKDVKSLQDFANMGAPKLIIMDNEPAFISKAFNYSVAIMTSFIRQGFLTIPRDKF